MTNMPRVSRYACYIPTVSYPPCPAFRVRVIILIVVVIAMLALMLSGYEASEAISAVAAAGLTAHEISRSLSGAARTS